jgi:hypothetical protein
MSTFTRFNSGDIVLSTEKINSNLFSDGVNEMSTFHTSSTNSGLQANNTYLNPSASGLFFLEVFKTPNPVATSSVEFSLAYGHKEGSGSTVFSAGAGGEGFTATRTVYNKYRQLVFGDESQNFTFNGTTPDDIYVINFERARLKQGLKPGSLNFRLASGSAGNHVVLHLTDDSITTTGSATLTNLGRQFNLVSGSSGTMLGTTLAQTTAGSYGFVYPDVGIIIMNPNALAVTLSSSAANVNGLSTSKTDTAGALNPQKFLTALQHPSASSFVVDAEEKVSSQFYFTRVTNQEFNYTTNPTFTDSQGVLKFDSMANNPKTFITTVGLYNDANELLAVAKLSQPLAKDFTKEALVRIKLDY